MVDAKQLITSAMSSLSDNPDLASLPDLQADKLTAFQALGIAASKPLPNEETFLQLMEIIGRHYGWVKGRLISLRDTRIEGKHELNWVHPTKFDSDLHDQTWNNELVPIICRQRDGGIIFNHESEEGLELYFPERKPGIEAYVGVPLLVNGECSATVEFFAAETIADLPNELDVLTHGVALMGLVVERGDAQARLRESERRFRGLFDQSVQLIALLKPDGTVIDINNTALEFVPGEYDQIIGKKFWEASLWPPLVDGHLDLETAVQRAGDGQIIRFETSVTGKKSETVVLDLTIKAVRNEGGEAVLLVAEGREITKLHAALQELRQTEQKLGEAQRIANLGHWEYSFKDGQATYSDIVWELFALEPQVVQGSAEQFINRIYPDDLSDLQRAITRSIRTGRPFEHQFRFIRDDESIGMVYTAGNTVMDEAGMPLRMTGIIQDISGRRQLEDSLAQSVERLSGLNLIGQIVATSNDLPAIYQSILSAGRKLLNSDTMVLFLHEGAELYVAAVDEEDRLNLDGIRISEHDGVAGNVWRAKSAVWLTGEDCREQRSSRLAAATSYEPESIIGVPVQWQDQFLGVLEVTHEHDHAFGDGDVSMMQSIANWIAIAIGKITQHETLQRRLQESEEIAAIGRALSQTLEPQVILDMIVNSAHDLVPRSDWAVIHILRGRPERLDPAAFAGDVEDLSDYVIDRNEGIAGLAIDEGRVINVGDTRIDPRSSTYARSTGLRSLLVAPIQSRNRALGTVSLHCMLPNAFTVEDERLLTILAAQAGLSIENTQLFDSQRRARLVAEMQRERLRVLADRIVTAQEEERLRISRELHDEAGQALTSLKISLDLIRSGLPPGLDTLNDRLADLANLTGNTMETLRTLAHDLRPPGLDAFGLNVALEGLCHDFAARTQLSVHYSGRDVPGLSTTTALSIYRFAQEALTNIAKHAEPQQVELNLTKEDKAMKLVIADDGKGFIIDQDSRVSNGIGLMSMQERIDLVGGSLEIVTAPNEGVRLTAVVPIESQ